MILGMGLGMACSTEEPEEALAEEIEDKCEDYARAVTTPEDEPPPRRGYRGKGKKGYSPPSSYEEKEQEIEERREQKKCESLLEDATEIAAKIDPEGTLEALEDWDEDEEGSTEELLEDLIDMLEDGE
jgi:hypothetical protein